MKELQTSPQWEENTQIANLMGSKPVPTQSPEMIGTEHTRAMQEVQGAIISAKQFPRDQFMAFDRIMQACQRPTLANKALYSYPRGGQTITGPSIRLAEVLLQNWGNCWCGVNELSQTQGESQVQAFAWDLETNVRDVKVFTVKHERKARGAIKKLDDPRDIYEMSANQGSRRKRACILAVLPADVVEAAVEKCQETIRNGIKGNLQDRIRKMIVAFGEMGVTKDLIEKRLSHKVEQMSPDEFIDLQAIYASIKDNVVSREQYFALGKKATEQDDLDKKILSEKETVVKGEKKK